MNPTDTVTLMVGFIRTALLVSTPLLLASLVAGLIVGVMQTATQVNEASVSYVVKVVVVVGVVVALGPTLASEMVRYTRECFTNIESVVK
jgi:flagellar biosynthetic protein FliQ